MCTVAALEIMTMSPRGCVRIDGSTSLLHDHAPNACVRIDPFELGRIGVGDGLPARRVAGVVHEDVDVAEVGDRGGDHRLALRVVVDRCRVRARAPAELLDLGDGLARRRPRRGGS